MQRRAAVLARIALVPVGVAAACLLFAGPAQADEAVVTPPDRTQELLMPIIGSGTHPIESQADSWGVGNG
jgi:hypothetical protein